MPRTLLYSLSAGALALTAACTPAGTATEGPNKADIEETVRAYLLDNPEVIEEALIELQARRDRAQAELAKASILENQTLLVGDNRDYSVGPDDAPVTLIEFFDYRCGPCRASMAWVNALPAKYDGKVRVVFKEFPILSPESRVASLAALAAGRQGRYVEMHQALMRDKSNFTIEDIEKVADRLELDIDQLRADMELQELQEKIADNYQLADIVGANATPTFIIGDDISSGLNRVKLEALISEGIAHAG